jgi:hypothetical protein
MGLEGSSGVVVATARPQVHSIIEPHAGTNTGQRSSARPVRRGLQRIDSTHGAYKRIALILGAIFRVAPRKAWEGITVVSIFSMVMRFIV